MNYWERRAIRQEAQAQEIGTLYLKMLHKEIDALKMKLQSEITEFYRQFAKEHKISQADANAYLNAAEQAQYSMEHYQSIMKAKGIDSIEADAAGLSHRISRKKALLSRLERIEEETFSDSIRPEVRKFSAEIYGRGRLEQAKTILLMEKEPELNVLYDRVSLPTLNDAIQRKWTDDNLNTLIDKHLTQLKRDVENTVNEGLTLELEDAEVLSRIEKRTNVAKARLKTLVRTEQSARNSMAVQDEIKQHQAPQYQLVATIDDRTSDICREINGKIYDSKDFQVGVTAPPFHPNCRTVVQPYFGDFDYFSTPKDTAAVDEAFKVLEQTLLDNIEKLSP